MYSFLYVSSDICYMCLFILQQELVIYLFSNVRHILEEQKEVHLTHKTNLFKHAKVVGRLRRSIWKLWKKFVLIKRIIQVITRGMRLRSNESFNLRLL